MYIKRTGASRNHGTLTIFEGDLTFEAEGDWQVNNNVSWDSVFKRVTIEARWVNDGNSHHHYTIELSLDDVSSLIALLGHAASALDAKLLRDHLKEQVPSIVKLLACATGLAPVPIVEDTDAVD